MDNCLIDLQEKNKNLFINELAKYPWFSNCGTSEFLSYGFDFRQLKHSKQVKAAITSVEWEEVTYWARGEFGDAVDRSKYASLFTEYWNPLVRQSKAYITDIVGPYIEKNPALASFEEDALIAVKWDVLHAALEQSYEKVNPPNFFQQRLSVYRSGHFPCGWENGQWPKGRMILY